MVEGIHGGFLQDGLDALLLGELGQFTTSGGIGDIFCGDCEEELFLDVLGCQGFDENGVGKDGDDGFRPGDDVGRDGPLDQVGLGQVT